MWMKGKKFPKKEKKARTKRGVRLANIRA